MKRYSMTGLTICFLQDNKIDESEKKAFSREVFEKMFPGTGFDFVRSKLVLRQKAATIDATDKHYKTAVDAARVFDTGMEKAQQEVDAIVDDGKYQPDGLKEYLLLGES